MNKRMAFGILITMIGLVFSAFCFIYAMMNPYDVNGIEGLLGAFLGTETLVPFIIATIVMCVGIIICFREAYRKEK